MNTVVPSEAESRLIISHGIHHIADRHPKIVLYLTSLLRANSSMPNSYLSSTMASTYHRRSFTQSMTLAHTGPIVAARFWRSQGMLIDEALGGTVALQRHSVTVEAGTQHSLPQR